MTESNKAVAKLADSRVSLKAAMAGRQSSGSKPPSPTAALLRRLPPGTFAADAAAGWWRKHPLHAVVDGLVQVADPVVRPLAREHPRTLLAGAVGAGMALGLARPWRLLRPLLLTGLVSRIAFGMVKRSSGVWLRGLAGAATRSVRRGPDVGSESGVTSSVARPVRSPPSAPTLGA